MILFNYLILFIRRYFCTGPKEGEVNLVPKMDNCGLFKDILGARNIVSSSCSKPNIIQRK